MLPSREVCYDVASVLNVGKREYQEDALATDFALGAAFGYAVLADGMGGHAAGDIASKIVVTEVFSELKFQSGDAEQLRETLPDVLRNAALSANECVRAHTEVNPETAGMGATLVAPVLVGDKLFWISIGDSPLFLFRDGELKQLNEDHSLAPQIDIMVQRGLITEDYGKNHPDRNCLTSVLIGEDIVSIDCPAEPLCLKASDIIIVASDGLQFLSNDQISEVLSRMTMKSSDEIAYALLEGIADLNDEQQDNVSFCVIRVIEPEQRQETRHIPHIVSSNEPATPKKEPTWASTRGRVPENDPVLAVIRAVSGDN